MPSLVLVYSYHIIILSHIVLYYYIVIILHHVYCHYTSYQFISNFNFLNRIAILRIWYTWPHQFLGSVKIHIELYISYWSYSVSLSENEMSVSLPVQKPTAEVNR